MRIRQTTKLIRTDYEWGRDDLERFARSAYESFKKQPFPYGHARFEWDHDDDGNPTLTLTVDAPQPDEVTS